MVDGDAQTRLADLARAWRVRIQRVELTRTSLLAFGLRADTRVVLKVLQADVGEWNSGAVAAAFGGQGMVRVYEHAPGAVLLEELRPGTHLADLVDAGRDDEATRILAGVIQAMSSASASTAGVDTAEDWASAFREYVASGDVQIPAALVEEAHARYLDLCGTQQSVRLLHGDLQHYNVLFDADRGWLAIDPKGVAAELEFELPAALRNPLRPVRLHSARAIERRIDQFRAVLSFDVPRVLGWTFAQAVLSAVWTVQDDGKIDPRAPALRVAEAARTLLR